LTDETTEPGREGLEPAVTPDEARKAGSGATVEDVDKLVPAVKVAKTHTNTDQTLIAVTADRAKIILMEAVEKLAQRRDWTGPLGLFVGLGMSVITADFQDTLGIKAQEVQGIVVTITTLAGLWTLVTVVRALLTPSKKKVVASTIDALKHQGSA
jgi:hypothetical protein